MSRTPRPDAFDEPYVSLGHLRGLFSYLDSKQVPLDPLYLAMDLAAEDLRVSDLRIPAELEHVAFTIAEALTGDPLVGLHAGCSMRPLHFGLLGHLLMASGHVGELFDLHTRYASLIGNASVPEYGRDGDDAYFVMKRVPSAATPTRQAVDYGLGGRLRMTSMLVGGHFALRRIELPYERPPEAEVLEATFRCPLSFGHEALRIVYPARYHELPLQGGDPLVKEALETEARRRIGATRSSGATASSRTEEIRRHIADRLDEGGPPIEEVAAALAISTRTLQRSLATERTSFKELVDDVRRELAESYVRRSDIPLADVALRIGFSDQTAFQRAFRRWFDTTPGAMRRSPR